MPGLIRVTLGIVAVLLGILPLALILTAALRSATAEAAAPAPGEVRAPEGEHLRLEWASYAPADLVQPSLE